MPRNIAPGTTGPPDHLIREIPLIRRYSRHNEAQDLRFVEFLKTGSSISNADLDTAVQETTDEVWKQIDCLACGNCCKTLQVVVDDHDVKRLSARLRLTPRAFLRRYVAVASDGVKYFTSSPCTFLGGDNRCSVYDDRPQACRDFPYLHAKGFRHRSLIALGNARMCPIVFNVWQRLKQRLWGSRR